MPLAPKRPCPVPRCPHLVPCPVHGQAQVEARRARSAEADARRPTARQRGYDMEWFKVRARFLRQHARCVCGAPATQVHHVVRLRDGGRHEPSNLRALCASCHSRLTWREDARFGQGRGDRKAGR